MLLTGKNLARIQEYIIFRLFAMPLFKKRNVQKRGVNKRRKDDESRGKSIKLEKVLKAAIENDGNSGNEEDDLQPLNVKFIRRGFGSVNAANAETHTGKYGTKVAGRPEGSKESTDADQNGNPIDRKLNDDLFKADRLAEDEFKARRERKRMEKALKKPQKRDKAGDKIYSGNLKSKKVDRWKPSSIHIKANNEVDYERDVCKDFLLNGYCGFGDSCKFLHYREEYAPVKKKKSREWEEVAKRHKKF